MSNNTTDVPARPALDVDLRPDPEAVAQAADLHYVRGDEPGYCRRPWGRGFTYLDPEGHHVKDPELRQRFENLVIPPAWTDVWICISPQGHIQATGRDAKGRKQYIYHPRWEVERNALKFSRMILFGEALPALRQQVDADLRQHKLTREKVTAVAVRLLEETLIRIGNEEYAQRNHSYGLTTLQEKHLTLSGSHIRIEFTGKHGKRQEVDVQDRRLARQVARCHELPGQELFTYLDEDDQLRQLSSTDVNTYLREHTHYDFTAKDFRTWGATVLAASILRDMPAAEEPGTRQKQVVEMVKQVAETLGNTPAVCREYYIHPAVIEAHLAGTLCQDTAVAAPVEGLNEPETAVLQFLRSRKM
ncbi:MAG: DNA topoisomerase IB [Ardenticatenaceae bacterium]|nr:DNA topoisomerase IB [Ardenticatenaceae bacterium]